MAKMLEYADYLAWVGCPPRDAEQVHLNPATGTEKGVTVVP